MHVSHGPLRVEFEEFEWKGEGIRGERHYRLVITTEAGNRVHVDSSNAGNQMSFHVLEHPPGRPIPTWPKETALEAMRRWQDE
jgi:hypothetical protein